MEFNPNNNPNPNPINPQTPPTGYSVPNNTPQYNQQPYNPPSAVNQNTYNNNGYVPQYHYGNPMPFVIDQRYYQEQQEKLLKRNAEKQKISKIGNLLGASLTVCLVLASIFSVFLVFFTIVVNFY